MSYLRENWLNFLFQNNLSTPSSLRLHRPRRHLILHSLPLSPLIASPSLLSKLPSTSTWPNPFPPHLRLRWEKKKKKQGRKEWDRRRKGKGEKKRKKREQEEKGEGVHEIERDAEATFRLFYFFVLKKQ
jgi:hypothetical protein